MGGRQGEIAFTFASPMAESLSRLPPVRGTAAVFSALLRITPISSEAQMHVGGQTHVTLDLGYRSHFAIVRSHLLGFGERLETNLVAGILRPGDTFFDCGANWGYFTAVASNFVGPNGLVVAIEPGANPFDRLRRMIVASRLANVLALNFALSGRNGDVVSMYRPWYQGDTAAHISKERGPRHRGTVGTRTLDGLWSQLGRPAVRMLKLDAEGFEPAILRSGYNCLRSGVTDVALVEVSSWSADRCGESSAVVYDLMREAGFDLSYVVDGGRNRLEPVTSDTCPTDVNVVFSKRSLAG